MLWINIHYNSIAQIIVIYRNTTHVIFKDGLQSTYNKAKSWNIPVVSILWIEACRKQIRLVDPKNFTISNVDRYDNPELHQKIRVRFKKNKFI